MPAQSATHATLPAGASAPVPAPQPPAPGLIPAALLAGADRILFIAHLAIGDFTYLQNDFRAFARAYPHLRIDLWVDEVRRTADPAQWPHLESYVLYDWAEGCGLFGTVYRRTYSPALMEQSLQAAQRERYPVVVSLATLRPQQYAVLARQIAGDGFAVGMRARPSLFQLHRLLAYRKLDATIAPHGAAGAAGATGTADDACNAIGHISGVYADWFRQLACIALPPAERFPFVEIPQQWSAKAIEQCGAWNPSGAIRQWIFVNPYAKTRKRCWPLERVAELIGAMQALPAWRDAGFIVNAVPQELATARAFFADRGLRQTELFSAEESFYELPAMLAQCALIISVETAVMHLANAVQVPVIALMRQKNPEWVPIDTAHSTVLTTMRRRDWVREITVPQVMQALQTIGKQK